MQWVKRLLVLLLLAIVLAFGVLFSIQNTDKTALDLLVLQLSPRSVSLWVILSFAFGGVVGMLISVVALAQLKGRVLVLQRKVEQQDKELVKFRTGEAKPALLGRGEKS
ncbi:LapA family protein [Oceanicoccus sp. KOV_DT_Chl]|uniref:LapA family protein n=1 Tax=Oceanicoccus sp. KOV_DT_Chl TaxID=1904639 RepID=UPI0013571E6C|nr:LapA family protein [Oceanicoccus sp. KOV_DT_Chl]